MSVDRPLCDEQPPADLPVGQAAGDQLGNLPLPPGQRQARARRRLRAALRPGPPGTPRPGAARRLLTSAPWRSPPAVVLHADALHYTNRPNPTLNDTIKTVYSRGHSTVRTARTLRRHNRPNPAACQRAIGPSGIAERS